jgi:hypothetical protein
VLKGQGRRGVNGLSDARKAPRLQAAVVARTHRAEFSVYLRLPGTIDFFYFCDVDLGGPRVRRASLAAMASRPWPLTRRHRSMTASRVSSVVPITARIVQASIRTKTSEWLRYFTAYHGFRGDGTC